MLTRYERFTFRTIIRVESNRRSRQQWLSATALSGDDVKRFQLLLSLGLASSLLLAACGGDDDDSGDDDTGDTPSATQTTASGETPSGGDATNTAEPDDDDDNGNGNGGGSELEERIRDLAGRSFQATYEVTTTVEGSEQTGTIVMAQDEPRFATVMELSDGTIAIIENDEGSFSCFGAGTVGICSRAADGQGSIFDLREVTDDAGDLASYNKIEDRNINGRDSDCWQGTEPESGVESTFCLSKDDGVLTLTSTGEFEMVLTDYSDDIDDELFELPYPVQ